MRGKRCRVAKVKVNSFLEVGINFVPGKMVVRVEAGPGKVVRAVLKSRVKKSLAKQFGKEG